MSAEREAFIRAMRAVATSVTVVTTEGTSGMHGATVSAFTSLSADPPSVLICLKTDSRIARAVTDNGVFCVNVLPDGDRAVADRFAGRFDDIQPDRFEGVDRADFAGTGPAIGGSTAFACKVHGKSEYASHTVFIGEVVDIRIGDCAPLTYLDGGYGSVSPSTGQQRTTCP